MGLPFAGIGSGSAIPMVANDFATATTPFLPIGIVSGVCNGVTGVTVAFPAVTANSIIVPSLKTVGGTVGALPAVQTVTAGTGFTFKGTASDTSTYNFLVIG